VTVGPVPRRGLRWHPLVLVSLAATAWVYRPLLGVYFFSDDFYHLAQVADWRRMAFIFAPFAGHNYVARNLVFVGMWKAFGMHTEPWYAIVLATHLLNVWLLFGVLCALTGSVALACYGATLWGTSPLAAGALGWYSVYGQVLVATVLLVVLALAARGAGAWVSWVLLLVGSTCFGIGVAVAAAFPAVRFLLVPATWRRPAVRVAWVALPAVTVALYVGCRSIGAWLQPLTPDQTIHEIAATHGYGFAPSMLGPLLGVGIAGAALGPFANAHDWHAAGLWTIVGIFALAVGVVTARADGRLRRTAIAMVVLALAVYASIAIGRASVFALFHADLAERAKAPRYHYVGMLPLVVLITVGLRALSEVRPLSAVPGRAALVAGLAILAVGYGRSRFAINQHPATRAYVGHVVAELEDAVRASPPGATVRLDNGSLPGAVFGPDLDVFFPGRAAIFLLVSPSDELDGRHVRFVEHDERTREYWRAHSAGRMATLLELRE